MEQLGYQISNMKKVIIINGNPKKECFNRAIANAYAEGAKDKGAEVRQINISDLDFQPNLAYGYTQRIELEPDLADALEQIKWAEHIVMVFPLWWGTVPALLKGFFDRVFLPGIAFSYRKGSQFWDKLFAGKTAHIICTMDAPAWYYRFILWQPGIRALRVSILGFVGIKTIRKTYFGAVRFSTPESRTRWLNQVRRMAEKDN
jgi:putative NADPH-quinone reductase